MFDCISRLYDRYQTRSAHARRAFVPSVQDKLEDRKLLSTASASSGIYNAFVFTKTLSSGDIDVYARLRKNGVIVRDNIPVAISTRHENTPAVAINSNGRFAVTWEDTLSSSDIDVKLRVFNASGNPLTSAMTVDSSTKKQYDASVSLNSFGRIVVAYTHVFSTTDLDVKAKQYLPTSSSGSSYSTSTFTIAAESNRNEFDPNVYVAPNGNWAVSYTRRFNSSDLDAKVFVRRNTNSTSSTYTVANSTSNEDATAVVSFDGSHLLRVSYRKNGQRFTKSLSV